MYCVYCCVSSSALTLLGLANKNLLQLSRKFSSVESGATPEMIISVFVCYICSTSIDIALWLVIWLSAWNYLTSLLLSLDHQCQKLYIVHIFRCHITVSLFSKVRKERGRPAGLDLEVFGQFSQTWPCKLGVFHIPTIIHRTSSEKHLEAVESDTNRN